MRVEEIREVILRDDQGTVLEQGQTIMYRDKTDRAYIAKYIGFDKGLVTLENITNDTQYNVRVSSLVHVVVVPNGGIENER